MKTILSSLNAGDTISSLFFVKRLAEIDGQGIAFSPSPW